MLSNAEKIGMTVAMILSCCILSLVSFAAGWENMPESQKEIVVTSGYFLCASLTLVSAAYCVWFVYIERKDRLVLEAAEYNERMANQFNVGQCISPRHWIDADDYRRLAIGSRK